MPHAPYVKARAYMIDPECWISYSGKSIGIKRALDVRRNSALAAATKEFNMPEDLRAKALEAVRSLAIKHGKNPALEILKRYGGNRFVDISPIYWPAVTRDCVAEQARRAGLVTLIKLMKLHSAVSAERSLSTSERYLMPPLKISMLLHFATLRQPYAPEPTRRSNAYVTFVRELLRDGLIERPTPAQRLANDGWSYRATARGQCFVKALTEMPLPVSSNPVWTMPTK